MKISSAAENLSDGWNISAAMRMQLRAQYEKMVERERQLGRYSRAAYIYARLLADLSGAALMLREGRFYQEAAIAYRDHLKSPLHAADCFAEEDSLMRRSLFIGEQNAWEKLADLYIRSGDDEKCREAWRSRADYLEAEGDIAKAADVLREQLCAEEEAYELLRSAWPSHSQAVICANKYLKWRGRAAEHAHARRFIEDAQGMDYDIPGEHRLLRY